MTEVQLAAVRNRLMVKLADAQRRLDEAIGPREREAAANKVAEIELES